MTRFAKWVRGLQLRLAWRGGASTSHDPHKSSRTSQTEGVAASRGYGRGTACSLYRRRRAVRRTDPRLRLLQLAASAQRGKRQDQTAANAEDRPRTSEVAGRSV